MKFNMLKKIFKFILDIKFFLYYITFWTSLGGGSGRRVGLKIQLGSPLVPVQVRLKANLRRLLRGSFFMRRMRTHKTKFCKRFSASEQRLEWRRRRAFDMKSCLTRTSKTARVSRGWNSKSNGHSIRNTLKTILAFFLI